MVESVTLELERLGAKGWRITGGVSRRDPLSCVPIEVSLRCFSGPPRCHSVDWMDHIRSVANPCLSFKVAYQDVSSFMTGPKRVTGQPLNANLSPPAEMN